jgi:hypothetical protein
LTVVNGNVLERMVLLVKLESGLVAVEADERIERMEARKATLEAMLRRLIFSIV